MKVIYIAGPYRAENAWEIEQNVRRAEALSLEVWKLGAVAICPHTMSRHFQGAAPDEMWLRGDLELVRRSDALILTKGWELSEGTRGEIHEAKRLGKKVFVYPEALAFWLESERAAQEATLA